MKSAIFSGRFDPPHAGHFMTIQRLLGEYSQVIVPILDYKEREACTALQAKMIFEYHFDMIIPPFLRNRVRFVVNKDHFGRISLANYHKLCRENDLYANSTVYLTGNREVLGHIKGLGLPCKYVRRHEIQQLDQHFFEGTKIRRELRVKRQDIGKLYDLKIV